MSPLHFEIFDQSRLTILTKFHQFKEKLILGGGSALCLQLGHRKSYDFDLFSSKPITPQFFHQITKVLGKNLEKLIDTQDQLSIILKNQVEITFLTLLLFSSIPIDPNKIHSFI